MRDLNAMLPTTYPWSLETLGRDGLLALLASADQLSQAASGGAPLPQLLRGKKLALLSDDHAGPDAAAFLRAATELGAHVARVRAGSEPGRRDPRDTAALLGQLYDGIECQGLPEAELRQLGRDAGVPVFDGIGSACHPLHVIADLMTQQDLAGDRPFDQMTVRFGGDPQSACGRTWHHVSGLLGVQSPAPATEATPDAAPVSEVPLPASQASPAAQALQASNRHHLLQAVLARALA